MGAQKCSRIVGGLVSTLCLWGTASGSDRLPAAVQARSFVSTLGWDHQLAVRCPDGVRAGVLALAGAPGSEAAAQELASALAGESGSGLKGRALQVSVLRVVRPEQLEPAVSRGQVHVLLLTPGVDPLLGEVGRVARVHHILVASGEAGHDAAAALVFVPQGEGARIRVNLEVAEGQGARFDARLLRLAELRGGKPAFERSEDVRARRVAGRDPEYPKIAQTAGVEGTVLVKVRIGPEGGVEEVNFLKSNEYFEDEISEAIRGWRFSPRLVDGRPTSTITTFRFEFRRR